jgi:PPOX class probable F420-dependent enzyme
VEQNEAVRRFADARVAVLATTGAHRPHLVPVVFAVAGDHIYTAVDHKPKRTRLLQRLSNIGSNPAVSLLVDEYDEDWSTLWWVRADGTAEIVEASEADKGLSRLEKKYSQYRGRRPQGPVIVVTVVRWSGWSAGTTEIG